MLLHYKHTFKTITILFLSSLFLIACSEKNYVDPMISKVLTDKALGESWDIMIQGQQLADDGKSIDEIAKTLPEGTIFSTNIFLVQI